MNRVGPFVTDRTGAYCEIRLASGENIIVGHEKEDFGAGRLTIVHSRLFGLVAETIFSCDLASADGKAAIDYITRNMPSRPAPLLALVEHVKDCVSVADVRRACSGFIPGR